MSWKNIKTFLILLFILINIYLVYSTFGFNFQKSNTTYVDNEVLNDTISIIKKNHNISINKKIIPKYIDNLSIIDVSNIIYTDKFKNSDYNFNIAGATFSCNIASETYSYNEENAKKQFTEILENIGISKDNYNITISKEDKGIVCIANEYVNSYHIFNGKIKAIFTSANISISGSWHIPPEEGSEKDNLPRKMADITGILIDMSNYAGKDDGTQTDIRNIKYGYYVSHYDKNTVSKSASAIPCYMLETDDGSKYYYDAVTGKQLNKED